MEFSEGECNWFSFGVLVNQAGFKQKSIQNSGQQKSQYFVNRPDSDGKKWPYFQKELAHIFRKEYENQTFVIQN